MRLALVCGWLGRAIALFALGALLLQLLYVLGRRRARSINEATAADDECDGRRRQSASWRLNEYPVRLELVVAADLCTKVCGGFCRCCARAPLPSRCARRRADRLQLVLQLCRLANAIRRAYSM